ncbi:LacI family transcriptional regulator [Paenibacillus sp. P25]|nr:LacI family transcriptional regulator [Paenibacillus sp. P25]
MDTHVTLKDIARIAGVSPATVSLALAGDPRVNVKTKQAVEDVARRLKYVPNEIGRSLRAKKSDTVALIFPNTPHNAFTHPYFVQSARGHYRGTGGERDASDRLGFSEGRDRFLR